VELSRAKQSPGRPRASDGDDERVRDVFTHSPKITDRQTSRELTILRSILHIILHRQRYDLNLAVSFVYYCFSVDILYVCGHSICLWTLYVSVDTLYVCGHYMSVDTLYVCGHSICLWTLCMSVDTLYVCGHTVLILCLLPSFCFFHTFVLYFLTLLVLNIFLFNFSCA
jgi:hypothetical protein